MLGAIIGDICGSVYEWDNERDINRIELFKEGCFPTDDSVMTVAVAKALVDTKGMTDRQVKGALIASMQYYGHLFPNAGYGGKFRNWLRTGSKEPINSFGNGSGMRVAAVGWLYGTYKETLHMAKLTAEVTHNHPEGIKGAQAIAAAIFLARTGKSKSEIREIIQRDFYPLDLTLDEIRKDYEFDVTCQGSCPQAIEAFLESESFEDAIKKAISIGGDSDTIAAMTGGIAEAFYGIPAELGDKAEEVLQNVKKADRIYNNSILLDELERFLKYRKTRSLHKSSNEENVGCIAEKSDWKTEEMPAINETFILNRAFTPEQMETLRHGHIPEEMEDKWFWYMDGNKLFAHRSWTGYCVFIIEFKPDNNHQVTVNRVEGQYNSNSIEKDKEYLNELLDWWSRPQYDYYGEWLTETVRMMKEAEKEGKC